MEAQGVEIHLPEGPRLDQNGAGLQSGSRAWATSQHRARRPQAVATPHPSCLPLTPESAGRSPAGR